MAQACPSRPPQRPQRHVPPCLLRALPGYFAQRGKAAGSISCASRRCFAELLTGKRFVMLARRACFASIVTALRLQEAPLELASSRDSAGESALAWAVYKARPSDACRRAILALLRAAPAMARAVDGVYGFLPIHSAAWGNAPVWVPALLCAHDPALLEARSRHGETAHQVGGYHHGFSFRWPAAEKLRQRAQAFARGMTLDALTAALGAAYLRHPGPEGAAQRGSAQRLVYAFGARLALATPVASLVIKFLQLEDHCPAVKVAAASVNRSLKLEAPILRPPMAAPAQQQPRRRERRRGSPGLAEGQDCEGAAAADGGVEVLREPAPKSRGVLAGAATVRHNRCPLAHRQEILAGGLRFTVHWSRARAVHPAVQRGPGSSPKWPSKRAWRLPRAAERLEKAAALAWSLAA